MRFASCRQDYAVATPPQHGSNVLRRGAVPSANLERAGGTFCGNVDIFAEEWPTTMSSRFLATAHPRADSEIVKRWRAAGTVFLGKTNTPEYADDFATEPAYVT